jgi:hypothetical protein
VKIIKILPRTRTQARQSALDCYKTKISYNREEKVKVKEEKAQEKTLVHTLMGRDILAQMQTLVFVVPGRNLCSPLIKTEVNPEVWASHNKIGRTIAKPLVPSYYCLYSLYNKIRDKGKIFSAGY